MYNKHCDLVSQGGCNFVAISSACATLAVQAVVHRCQQSEQTGPLLPASHASACSSCSSNALQAGTKRGVGHRSTLELLSTASLKMAEEVATGLPTLRSPQRALPAVQVTQKILQYGSVMDPHAVFLLQRGMATLGLRVRQQNKTGLAAARFLAKHPLVQFPCHVFFTFQPRACL